MNKTRKITFEGSSKPIKLVYLLGTILYNYTNWLFVVTIFVGFVDIWLFFSHQWYIEHEIFYKIGILLFIFNSIGVFIIRTAQFLNWMDRGSINSKIFR